MGKQADRVKMKAIKIALIIARVQSYRITGRLTMPMLDAMRVELDAVRQTPAKLFRHDKPELDKRRCKQYQDKGIKGKWVVRPNVENRNG